jgi:ABC-type sugar transport system permease subunit
MKKHIELIMVLIISVSLVFLFAVCFHSLEEIHYLKSFFPQTFTMEQAFYASVIELIKIAIIAVPLVVVIYIGLFYLKNRKQI